MSGEKISFAWFGQRGCESEMDMLVGKTVM